MSPVFTRGACLLGSLAVHAWLLLGITVQSAAPRLPFPPVFVQLTVTQETKPVEPELPPPPQPPEPENPTPKLRPLPPPEDKPPEPEPLVKEAQLPRAPSPAELTGTTLVSDTGIGWAAPLGSGAERDGMVRSAVA